jgi:hypothetical protein
MDKVNTSLVPVLLRFLGVAMIADRCCETTYREELDVSDDALDQEVPGRGARGD